MALTPATLEVVPEHIAAGGVWIAPGVDGEIAGVVALAPGDAPDTLNLNKLFVEPRDIRSGIGQGPGPRKSSCATAAKAASTRGSLTPPAAITCFAKARRMISVRARDPSGLHGG
jgi:hypothetical protein